jgi:hypothetical protein
MTEHPWKTEPDSLDFEADGLPCAMRRNSHLGIWCGYVGVGPEHPLFGLPTNHPLRLPAAWFEGHSIKDGYGPFDLFILALSGAGSIEEACPISLAFEVHGGLNYADDTIYDHPQDGRWWFGFDCGHAGDYLPGRPDFKEIMDEMVESLPEEARDIVRRVMTPAPGNYRDQHYVVSECQSLAAQLNAIVAVIEKEKAHGGPDDRRD